jgi:hypothetical protein
MSYYYDKYGMPISLERWATLMEKDDRILAQTVVGDYLVSTVWLGLDHNIFGSTPMIFESCVFYIPDGEGGKWITTLEPIRYPTRRAAIAGHQKILQEVRDGKHSYNPTEELGREEDSFPTDG